ncbi:MAG: hypothetical protein A2Z11_04710 [Candidatus Woykebacteria bacterium RBG_16_43_9]|uniref:Uncharacterized protein n=1 Tax=Candidatus Woykebacteria bacterium RBG_16_43_9 TaxID=1802596 RepID=A0A1G1WD40_9BACT|nr:MAG: hypothetical protein A2Z11_04710 [Candidatus Woykebacteria bacterium RBG_16_43_9]
MPTLLDIAIGLPILIIEEDQRLRHERFLFFLEIFSALMCPVTRPRRKLVDGSYGLGYEIVSVDEAEEEGETEYELFSLPPIKQKDILPGGVLAHVN